MKLFITLLLILISLDVFAPAENSLVIIRNKPLCPYLPYFEATGRIESQSRLNAINLSDPNGGSWGIVQIGLLKITDFNKANHTNYTLKDCLDIEVSRKIFYWHCEQYRDIDKALKAWNGKGKRADEYVKRVKAEL